MQIAQACKNLNMTCKKQEHRYNFSFLVFEMRCSKKNKKTKQAVVTRKPFFFFLPEQLRVDERDDILQGLECWANQKVGSKGSDEGMQERRLMRSSFLIRQQHFYFLWAAFTSSSSSDVVCGRRRGLGVRSLAGQILFTGEFGCDRKERKSNSNEDREL